jgi:hypothetical protein
MATTYDKIATSTLSVAGTSITFSSIAATYTDLRLVWVGAYNTATNGEIWIRVNGDTATNYSTTEVTGTGAAATTSNTTSDSKFIASVYAITANQPTLMTSDIFSYAGSTNKSFLNTCSQDANGGGQVVRQVGLWRSTSAITSVTVQAGTAGLFLAGTSATLYGIKAA